MCESLASDWRLSGHLRGGFVQIDVAVDPKIIYSNPVVGQAKGRVARTKFVRWSQRPGRGLEVWRYPSRCNQTHLHHRFVLIRHLHQSMCSESCFYFFLGIFHEHSIEVHKLKIVEAPFWEFIIELVH